LNLFKIHYTEFQGPTLSTASVISTS